MKYSKFEEEKSLNYLVFFIVFQELHEQALQAISVQHEPGVQGVATFKKNGK
jgi:hypothetical protein